MTTHMSGPDVQVVEKPIWPQAIKMVMDPKTCSFFY